MILNPVVGQGWSMFFWGCRARRNDAERLFHSKELQRSHVPQKKHNLPCSELTKKVKIKCRKKTIQIRAVTE
jgi:hypothetical protein